MKKRCTKCKELKLPSEFHVNKKAYDGLCPECKPCKLSRNEKYIKKDWLKMYVIG